MKKLALLFTILLICASCTACRADIETINASWYQVISSDFKGWRVYISNVSEEYGNHYTIPSNPEAELSLEYNEEMSEPYGMQIEVPVPVGIPYEVFVVVRSLDLAGNESDPCDEGSKVFFIPVPTTIPTTIPTTSIPEDTTPPEDPYNLIISMMYWQYRTIALDLT